MTVNMRMQMNKRMQMKMKMTMEMRMLPRSQGCEGLGIGLYQPGGEQVFNIFPLIISTSIMLLCHHQSVGRATLYNTFHDIKILSFML